MMRIQGIVSVSGRLKAVMMWAKEAQVEIRGASVVRLRREIRRRNC